MRFPQSLTLRCCSGTRVSVGGSSMTMSRGTCIARRPRISEHITTTSAGRIPHPTRRTICIPRIRLDRDTTVTMTQIDRLGGGIIITIDVSALNIPRLALADTNIALYQGQTAADQASHRRDLHRPLHLRSVPAGPGVEIDTPGTGTRLTQGWRMYLSPRECQTKGFETRTTGTSPDGDPTITTHRHHRIRTHAVIPTTRIPGGP